MSQTHLVVGPPGTGKTHELTRQASRAAAKYGRDGVCILSLTRTAAHNVAGRTDLPEPAVGTLHSACYRGLGIDRDQLADTPARLREFSDAHPAWEITGGGAPDPDEAALEDPTGGQTYGDQLRASIEGRRQRLEPWEAWTDDERAMHQAWVDYKTQTQTVDFTDLLEHALANLDQHPRKPSVLLVDEAQDHSALELGLVRKWAAATEHTVLAGDPDQAIFAFRGASPDNLLAAEYATTRVLERSRRVPAAVHHLATRWLATDTDHPHAAYQPRLVDPDDPATGVAAGAARTLPVTLRAPAELVDDAEQQLAAGRSVMILATCGYMLAPLVSELRARGIPFCNPYRPTAGAWNPMRGTRRLAAFLRPTMPGNPLWTWDDLRLFTDPLNAKGALVRGGKARIAERIRILANFHGRPESEAVTLPELRELLLPHAYERVLDSDVDWWQSELRATERKRYDYAVEVHQRLGLAGLTEQPRLIVGTVHSVKGGEADVVYLAPDLSRKAMWQGWHADPAARAALRRLIYVGLTRAREEIVLLAASGPEHVPTDDLETTP